ncbi:hypothetical protein IFM89_012087 [Coptis chinensis]|uniref:60S ribosomal protein L18a-like protein n=1 Tax=Coptis chinensis TaxID=261450 RepID=A0A835LZK6_9MAGN|nr:hypothetical protein IFM89_012087 [Coptis chinensis]
MLKTWNSRLAIISLDSLNGASHSCTPLSQAICCEVCRSEGAGGEQHGEKATVPQPQEEGNTALLNSSNGLYDKPLTCFGCGIGWLFFVLGFLLPLLWYYATFLYFCNYYLKDPRERAGLAASATAALIFSLALFITVIVVFC